jgi:hypothetical protein
MSIRREHDRAFSLFLSCRGLKEALDAMYRVILLHPSNPSSNYIASVETKT